MRASVGAGFAILLGVAVAAIYETYRNDASTRAISLSHERYDRLSELALRSRDAALCAEQFSNTGAFDDSCRVALAREQEVARDIDHGWPVGGLVNEQAVAILSALGSPVEMRRAIAEKAAGGLKLQSAIAEVQEQESKQIAEEENHFQAVSARIRYLFELNAGVSLLLIAIAGMRMSADRRRRGEAELALASRDAQYRQVVESAGQIIYQADRQGRFTFCNQAALSLLHFEESDVMGRSYLKLIRADKRRQMESFYLRQVLRRRKSTYYEFPIIDGENNERWIGQNVQLVLQNGEPAGFQAIAQDITERRRAEMELDRSRAFVERIAATTPGILYVYDLELGRNVFTNREVTQMLGYRTEELTDPGEATKDLMHPDDMAAVTAHHDSLRQALDGEVRRLEYRARHKAGHWVWLASRDTPFERGADGQVRQIVGIAQDVTVRRAAQEKLVYQANYDALTGLPNRHHFWTRLQSVLRRASLEHLSASICLFDVDHFKDINDRFGHAAGDEVLEAVGSIVQNELRAVDGAGRMGGDEFCFVLPETDQNEAARVSDRIRERLSTMAFGVGSGSPFTATATFGVAAWTPQLDAKELLEIADRALYRAKLAGRNRVCVES